MVNKLPEKLTMLRKHYGYSQGDIANKLHIPVTEYMNWENGNTVCGIQQLKVLSDLFHVSLDAMADNTKDIVIADTDIGDSVNIPFLNNAATSMTQQMDVADNMMPVSGVLPADTQQTLKVNTLQEENLGSTKQMGTVAQAPEAAPAPKTVNKAAAPQKPAKNTKNPKKKKTLILVGCICAAAVAAVILIIILMKPGSSSVSLGSVNRLAEGDKYTLFIDNKGSLKTYGTFSNASAFKGTVQVSAYGSHAAGLTSKGTVVTTDNDSAVSGWKNITMVAAGKNHTVGLKSDGTVACSGDSDACAVSEWKDIKAVYAGDGVTVGLTSDGTLETAGSLNSAVSNQSNVASVSMNDDILTVTKKDGTVSAYAIGSKAVISTSSFSKITSTAVGSEAVIGLKSDGTVSVATNNTDLEKAIGEWKDIKYIAAYNNTYVAVDSSGNLYGTGDNTYNQYESTASASPSADTGKLDTPKNIQTDLTTANLSIKWDTVENADYYEVTVSGLDMIKAASNSTSVPTSSLENGKEYTITIIACSDKPETHPNSDEATTTYTYNTLSKQLEAPGNITGYAYQNFDVSEFIINWNAVPNADYYTVSIQGGPDQQFTTNSAEISLDHTNITESTTNINVAITACSNSTAYTASDTTKTLLAYSVNKKDVKITYATADGSYAKTITVSQLPYGKYKMSTYVTNEVTSNGKYKLDNTDQTFEVNASNASFSAVLIAAGEGVTS